MAILNYQLQTIGQSGSLPAIIYINTNNTIAEVTAAGYLNPLVAQGNALNEQMIALVGTKTSPNDIDSEVNWYRVDIAAGVYSLVSTSAAGSVTLPTIANHLAIYTNTGGVLSEDAATAINGGNIQAGLSGTAGYLASFPATGSKGSLRLTAVANTGDTLVTISNAAHGQASVYSIQDCGASTANLLLSKTTGTQHVTVGNLQIDAGSLSTGITTGGTAGGFIAYPATASKGSLRIVPVDNTGDTATTISNAAMGQASVVSIPDPGNAAARFLVAATATPFTSGNLVKSSGTGGLVVDAGFAVKANTTAAYAGGGTSNAFVATGISATSIVTASILASTNSVSITKVVPTANTLTVTFSADPGAATQVSWIAITPAV